MNSGINKNEILWVQYLTDGKVTHLITSDKNRSIYYLYEVVNGKGVKTKYKANTPTELEKWVKR